MCGLVGIAGNLFSREELAMKRLLLLDSIRGMDSTGIAVVRMGGKKVEVVKKATHCFNLFEYKSFSEALSGTSSMVFMGHNRSATIGKINDINAHPFQIDHITGVHNGTLEDKDKKMLEDWLGEKFNTDSEALFAAIAKFGVKEVIPKLHKGRDQYKGAWSLVWWNSEDNTLNFLRNEHRPLWYCYSEDFKLIFWASEFWMLDAALQKSGNYLLFKKKSDKHPEKTFRFFSTETDVHYTVDVEKLSKGSKDRPKITAAKLAGKEPEEVGTSFPFVERSSERHGSGCGSKKWPQSKITNRTNTSSDSGIITLVGSIEEPYAGYYKQTGFSLLGSCYDTRKGGPECSWCHEYIPYGQPGLTIYTRDNVIICAKCSGCEPVSMLADFAPATRIYVPRLAFNDLRG
jgi:predicted glutamine amidotransferase